MTRVSRLAIAFIAVVLTVIVVVALADSGLLAHRDQTSPRTASTLEDLRGTFVSTTAGSVTPRPLLAGHPIRVEFTGDRLSANAGCNAMSGTASLVAGRLITGPLVQTMMACEPPGVMEQETWVREMFRVGPAVTLSDGHLVLTWQGYTLLLDPSTGPTPTTTTVPPTPTSSDLPTPMTTTAPPPSGSSPVPTSSPSLTTIPESPFNTIPETPQGAGN